MKHKNEMVFNYNDNKSRLSNLESYIVNSIDENIRSNISIDTDGRFYYTNTQTYTPVYFDPLDICRRG